MEVENSRDKAIAYIEDYRAKYGEDYCYVPGVILVQAAAALQTGEVIHTNNNILS